MILEVWVHIYVHSLGEISVSRAVCHLSCAGDVYTGASNCIVAYNLETSRLGVCAFSKIVSAACAGGSSGKDGYLSLQIALTPWYVNMSKAVNDRFTDSSTNPQTCPPGTGPLLCLSPTFPWWSLPSFWLSGVQWGSDSLTVLVSILCHIYIVGRVEATVCISCR